MNLYISDLHFGHKNSIVFDRRPFDDVDQMDRWLIKFWNCRVGNDDDIYIVGDFCYKSARAPEWYLRQLKGHKHLVIGNHDKAVLDSVNAMHYIESMDNLMYISDGGKRVCLCHYPLAEWYGSRRDAWHIYGHIHGSRGPSYQYMKTQERAMNAAACINNYTPSSFLELVENNRRFKEAEKEENNGEN